MPLILIKKDLKRMKQKIKQIAGILTGGAVLAAMVAFPGAQIKKQAEQEPKKFGATYMTMNNPYFIALNESIREGIEANGDVLITRDPAQDQDRQNEQIREMIDEGVTAIFLNPVDWTEVSEGLKMCKEAGVAVFNVDTKVYEQNMVESVIWSDNYQAGVQCAKDMMKKKAKADILIMKHYNIQSTNERVEGFLDTIEGHDEYKIVEELTTTSEFEVSMEEMDRVINKGMKFDAVMTSDDSIAAGAVKFAHTHGIRIPEDLEVIGYNNSVLSLCTEPELTSVDSKVEELSSCAVSVLMKVLSGEDADNHSIIAADIIKRNTTIF